MVTATLLLLQSFLLCQAQYEYGYDDEYEYGDEYGKRISDGRRLQCIELGTVQIHMFDSILHSIRGAERLQVQWIRDCPIMSNANTQIKYLIPSKFDIVDAPPVSRGQGECRTTYRGYLFCYVERGVCSDQQESRRTSRGSYWSYEACGRLYCTRKYFDQINLQSQYHSIIT